MKPQVKNIIHKDTFKINYIDNHYVCNKKYMNKQEFIQCIIKKYYHIEKKEYLEKRVTERVRSGWLYPYYIDGSSTRYRFKLLKEIVKKPLPNAFRVWYY